VQDRAKQYRYFKTHDLIDALVQDHFVRDDAFRLAVLEDPAELVTLQARIDELNTRIPDESADAWLSAALAEATAQENIALEVRIKAAFANAEEPALVPEPQFLALWDAPEQWAKLGANGKLWILDAHAQTDPARVAVLLEAERLDYINTPNELALHRLQAECFQRLERIDASIESYRMLIKRFAQAKESGGASMQIGQMEVARGNGAAARAELELILHRNEWRGQMHAEALLWIGRAYVAGEEYAKAHGFYERIILGYPGFQEELAMAFYEDIQVLKLMGEAESVQMVYEAFKLTPGLEDTEGAVLIGKEFE
jgi:tetratricopeptide (TPR) repeat protein